jgi:hypothetical protein
MELPCNNEFVVNGRIAMTAREQLLKEIDQGSDALIEEVLDFLYVVKTRQSQSANSNEEKSYDKVSRSRGLLRDRKEELLTRISHKS